MIVKPILSEIKCIAIALAFTFVLVTFFNNNLDLESVNTDSVNSFFGLSKFFENLVFFVFSTFVVFGVKGFFEKYSQKVANVIIIVTGFLLILAVIFLSYQILFRI
jgi:hypothetical protein